MDRLLRQEGLLESKRDKFSRLDWGTVAMVAAMAVALVVIVVWGIGAWAG